MKGLVAGNVGFTKLAMSVQGSTKMAVVVHVWLNWVLSVFVNVAVIEIDVVHYY